MSNIALYPNHLKQAFLTWETKSELAWKFTERTKMANDNGFSGT